VVVMRTSSTGAAVTTSRLLGPPRVMLLVTVEVLDELVEVVLVFLQLTYLVLLAPVYVATLLVAAAVLVWVAVAAKTVERVDEAL
jgi:hypothetical protein